MLNGQQKAILPQLRRLMGGPIGPDSSDRQLLERFLANHDAAAFAALVRRHGRTVLGVCRRVLGNPHDAEDAFQATFLVLVRKARSISKREAVGSWLYGVAYRVALKVQAEALRRRRHEREAASRAAGQARPEAGKDEVGPIIDEEVKRLPDKYRRPIVLCYFEGRTYEEAARVLGCPAGTASARLARARELLRTRLRLRGVALSSSALIAWFAAETACAADACFLTDATVQVALRLAADHGVATSSSQVIAVTQGVVKAMFMRKLKTVAGVLLAATVTCVGAGVLCRGGLLTLAAAGGPPLQAADAGAVPSVGEPLFAVADNPPEEAGDSPVSRAEPREPTDDSPRTTPPRALAPPAEGAPALHTRIGLINMTRVLKAATAYRSFQEKLRAQTKHAQQKLESLKAQMRQVQAESDDPAREKRLRDLQREMEDEQQRAKAKLSKMTADALTRTYREVEEAANRYARFKGLELVMFYTDAVSEADFYNPTTLQRKLTQPGALMPLVVAPGMDITEAVVERLNRTRPSPGDSGY